MSGSSSPTLDAEVTYISGVTSSGTIAAISSKTWDGTSNPAVYTNTSNYSAANKWAPGGVSNNASAIGSPGGLQYYYFDPKSHFTAAQQAALVSGLEMWSAVANI